MMWLSPSKQVPTIRHVIRDCLNVRLGLALSPYACVSLLCKMIFLLICGLGQRLSLAKGLGYDDSMAALCASLTGSTCRTGRQVK
jgi:hypothetical protein